MDHLNGELDLCFHKGLDPDVYYRCHYLPVFVPWSQHISSSCVGPILEAIRETDGSEYLESSAHNRDGNDGVRFRFVCRDSIQNRYHKSSIKKDASHDFDGSDVNHTTKNSHGALPTYDCGGAVHINFSLKRQAINDL